MDSPLVAGSSMISPSSKPRNHLRRGVRVVDKIRPFLDSEITASVGSSQISFTASPFPRLRDHYSPVPLRAAPSSRPSLRLAAFDILAVFLGGNKPSRTGVVRGDISVYFSCDPDISSKLVDLALEEILYLQNQGPSEQDVSTVLEIEQRAHENGLQENYYWLDRILRSYQSRA